MGLFDDHTLVLMARFDAPRAVDLIERHRVASMYLPPILMQRIAALPGVGARDFSSVQTVSPAWRPSRAWARPARRG